MIISNFFIFLTFYWHVPLFALIFTAQHCISLHSLYFTVLFLCNACHFMLLHFILSTVIAEHSYYILFDCTARLFCMSLCEHTHTTHWHGSCCIFGNFVGRSSFFRPQFSRPKSHTWPHARHRVSSKHSRWKFIHTWSATLLHELQRRCYWTVPRILDLGRQKQYKSCVRGSQQLCSKGSRWRDAKQLTADACDSKPVHAIGGHSNDMAWTLARSRNHFKFSGQHEPSFTFQIVVRSSWCKPAKNGPSSSEHDGCGESRTQGSKPELVLLVFVSSAKDKAFE